MKEDTALNALESMKIDLSEELKEVREKLLVLDKERMEYTHLAKYLSSVLEGVELIQQNKQKSISQTKRIKNLYNLD